MLCISISPVSCVWLGTGSSAEIVFAATDYCYLSLPGHCFPSLPLFFKDYYCEYAMDLYI